MSDRNTNQNQPMYVVQPVRETNGIGTAGFVLSLIALVGGWLPFIGWLVWLLGLIFSIIGVTRKPNGLAIAGLIISLIGLVLLILIIILGIGIMGAGALLSSIG